MAERDVRNFSAEWMGRIGAAGQITDQARQADTSPGII